MADKKVTVLAFFKAKPGMEAAVEQAIRALVEPTRQEAGCINYDLHRSSDDSGLFMLYENWVSKKVLDEHLKMPYLKDLIGKAEQILAQPIDIKLWEMLTELEKD